MREKMGGTCKVKRGWQRLKRGGKVKGGKGKKFREVMGKWRTGRGPWKDKGEK